MCVVHTQGTHACLLPANVRFCAVELHDTVTARHVGPLEEHIGGD